MLYAVVITQAKRFDHRNIISDLITELGAFISMQLNHIQTIIFYRFHQFLISRIYKHSDFNNFAFDLSHFFRAYLLYHVPRRSRVKNKPGKCYSQIIQGIYLLRQCVSTNFNLHLLLLFNCFTNSAKAIVGLVTFIKFSPIRKPWKPCCLKSKISLTLLIPLSAILNLGKGILSAIRKLFSISTSKVFRLRLLIPMKSVSSQICSNSSSA